MWLKIWEWELILDCAVKAIPTRASVVGDVMQLIENKNGKEKEK